MSTNGLVSQALWRFAQGHLMNLELPVEHDGYYSVRFTLPQELRSWSGRALVRIDAMTGVVIAGYDPVTAPALNRIDDAAYPIHLGEAAGLVGRIIMFPAGLACRFSTAPGCGCGGNAASRHVGAARTRSVCRRPSWSMRL